MDLFKTTGALLLIASFLSPWLETPYLKSEALTVYPFLALCCGLLLAISFFVRSALLPFFCGIGCLFLNLFALFLLALSPVSLRRLILENEQYRVLSAFSKSYFTPNLNSESVTSDPMLLDTFIGRIDVALHFQGFGWWFCLFAGLLLVATTVYRITRVAIPVSTLLLLLIATTVACSLGLSAQWDQERVNAEAISGNVDQAAAFYKEVLTGGPSFHDREAALVALGELRYISGQENVWESLFYQGYRAHQDKDFSVAQTLLRLAYEYEDSAGRKASGNDIVARYLSFALLEEGLARYRNNRADLALVAWKEALVVAPEQSHIHFLLGKGYYDQKSYLDSQNHYSALLELSEDVLLNANIMAGIGDALWAQKHFDQARLAYEASIRLDDKGNLRVLKALGGT
ncbi:MAG: tetratricopeptide repeat protein [Desulfuromonadales bacterium]|nr:tetratricopeptide repeat protein [Desulfuromonadales bacterium]